MSAEALPSALEAFGEITAILGKQPVVLLDYDGTLTPIVSDPADAKTGEEMRDLLATLARHIPVAVISGRDLDDLRARVAVEGVIYSGNHGWEIEGPGLEFRYPQGGEVEEDLAAAYELLDGGAGDLPGVAVERKRYAIAVHTRRAASDLVRSQAADLAANTVAGFERLRLMVGREIYELRPAVAWDKGMALGYVLDSLGPGWVSIYIGDDRTDEDAFREAARRRGVGVVVGTPDATSARFTLADPGEVMQFLRKLGDAV